MIAFQPNSGVVVSPIKTAPAALSRLTDGASRVHAVADVVRLPYLTAQSLTHTISLIVVGTPSMRDEGAPLRHRAVDSFAIAKAASASISEKALNRSCTCPARASVACATSRGVNFPELKPAESSPTPNRHSSFASARNRLFIIIPMCPNAPAKTVVGEIDGKSSGQPCQSGAPSTPMALPTRLIRTCVKRRPSPRPVRRIGRLQREPALAIE